MTPDGPLTWKILQDARRRLKEVERRFVYRCDHCGTMAKFFTAREYPAKELFAFCSVCEARGIDVMTRHQLLHPGNSILFRPPNKDA